MDQAYCDSELSTSGFLTPYDSLMNAATDAAAMQQLQGAAQDLGFERVMFAVIPQPKTNIADVFLRSNYPEDWRAHYERHNLRATDPTVEHCFKSNAPFAWMPQSFKTPAQQSLYEEASAFGLKVGVTLPIRGVDGEVGMLTCVRDEAPGAKFLRDLYQNLSALTLLRDVAFEAMSKFIHAEAVVEDAPALTARELDSLQWLAAGKTAWEIGRILSISEAGANFHIGNLRRKFRVNRRSDVVLKAIRLGLIEMPS